MATAAAKPSKHRPRKPVEISNTQARAIWIDAQRLNESAPFGRGADAVAAAIAHLGYVQIDTINVIERCHHHILFNRIPTYQRTDLSHAQSTAKTIFEYWTHALSFVPANDFRYFIGAMKQHRKEPRWTDDADKKSLRRVLKRVRDTGPLTISDIKDDKLVEKTHAWGSRKPSKRALQHGFYGGQLVIARRDGMLKTYELTERHFGWERLPKAATEPQTIAYLLDRALRAQGLVSLDSICHLNAKSKPAISGLIEKRVRAKKLVPITITNQDGLTYWTQPGTLEKQITVPPLTHILSPFDPLIIQRRRTNLIFDYDHLFEAYVPKHKRKMGYFTLPVLIGDQILAAIDLKTDRQAQKLIIQNWHWVGTGNKSDHQQQIDDALHLFGQFQLSQSAAPPA